MTNNFTDGFIKIENDFITEGNELHMNDKEIYLYSILYMNKRIDGRQLTTLSLISSFMKSTFSVQEYRNVKYLKEALIGLIEKGLVAIYDKDYTSIEVKDIKSSDPLCINIININSNGHTQVRNDRFLEFRNPQEYYIYLAVKRWENTKEGCFVCNYERFSDILKVSRSTATKNIELAIKNKVVYRNTGDFYKKEGRVQQYMNQYKCTPFNEDQKTMTTKVKDYKNRYSLDIVLDDADCPYDNEILEEYIVNWEMFDAPDGFGMTESYVPTDIDCEMYLDVVEQVKGRLPTRLEAKLIDKAEWRMNVIANSTHFDLQEEMQRNMEMARGEISSNANDETDGLEERKYTIEIPDSISDLF